MHSIETRSSWVVAWTALAIVSVAFGAPQIVVVALRPIAAQLGDSRAIPSAAYSLAWLGMAVGGVGMGWIADRIGTRYTVAFGAAMIAIGLMLASGGKAWQLVVGYGLFVGLLGNAGLNAPLYVYVSRWFDRRRGTALALISSGQYVAGALWPMLFEQAIQRLGWPHTMRVFGVFQVVVVLPAALLVLRAPPEPVQTGATADGPRPGHAVLGMPANLTLLLLAVASFCCCVPMAMPQGQLVAFCGDLGIPAEQGAAMLSVLLACAFASRQFWGWLSDRIGGLSTVVICSACQLVSMAGFMLARSELDLFLVSILFGLGFSGLIPAYVLAIRELFPSSEAGWRVPSLLLLSGSGMATGGWLAGWIFDRTGFYGAAFAAGMGFNLLNLLVVGFLLMQARQLRQAAAMRTA
ncbi:MAG TPA: MFS transporter [Acetobacteraceae bacterium]|nr:MFS transporter [Acetobacteraceae bacterium]